MTDIDLWVYERPAALTRRRLIVDAKNRRSPKVSERIIWASGLRAALRVDGAIVATTDRRPAARNLAKALNVVLLDGDAITKLTRSEQLNKAGQLRSEELDQAVKRIDDSRRTSEWRQNLRDARGSLISGMGVQPANRNLEASRFFAEQAVAAQPHSERTPGRDHQRRQVRRRRRGFDAPPVFAAGLEFAADSPLEESGFEPLVPLTPKNGNDTGERDAQISTR